MRHRVMIHPQNQRIWRRILPWVIGIVALLSAGTQLFRMLWFDEVLTVNLLAGLPFSRIYFAYEIPNNHIVFTLLEKLWLEAVLRQGGFACFHFRLVPAVCGCAAVFLMTRKLIRTSGPAAGVLVPAVFAVSSVFAMYATAVRGYMTGFLLTVLAVLQAEKVIRRGSVRDGLLYFLLAVLAVGTAPTNLAALTAVMVYFLPSGVRRGRCGVRRLVFLAAAPGAALVLFYLPIVDKFIGCIRLGEGWPDTASAIYAFYTGALFPLAGLLVFCVAGAIRIWRKYPRLRLNCLCGLAILLLPLAAYCVMKIPPFPRVFFPLTAVWLFLAAHTLNAGFRMMRRWKFAVPAVFLLQSVFCYPFFGERAERAGNFFYGPDGRGDDYIAPYYARSSFEPNRLLEYLSRKYREEGFFHVFATFDSDAPSLTFAAVLLDFPEGVLLADALNRPKTLRMQDIPGRKYIVSSGEADLQGALKRFGFRSAVLEKQFGLQHLYRVLE